MNILVIHPEDTSTNFLTDIYAPVAKKKVIREGVDKYAILKTIPSYDQVMMMGHGTAFGLLSLRKYISPDHYIVDDAFVHTIKKKKNSLFIWCHANRFVETYRLKGFYTGMFISEVNEAMYCGLGNIHQELVDESNTLFSTLMADVISEPVTEIYQYVQAKYGESAEKNAVVAYNHQRLYCAN